MKGGFVFKILLAGVIVSALMAGCLNPMSFNEDDLPTIKVTGEISIDNINSAELNFRNHTYSVDVTKIDVIQHKLETSNSPDEPLPVRTPKLDARISGSPTAGTQDALLVRPTGTNILNNVTVESYTIQVWYKKAQNIPPEIKEKLEGFTDFDNPPDRPLEVTIDELPRGRCVFHLYRNKSGNIAIDVEGVTDDPDYNDHRDDGDFVPDVKSQVNVDLSGLELAVNLPPIEIAGQPIEVTFSEELLTAVNAAFGDLANSIDKVATSVIDIGADIASSVESYRLFGRDTGLLVVRNWTSEPVTVEVPNGNTTYFIGPVATGDLDGVLLSTKGTGKYSVKVISDLSDSAIQTKNTYVFNQKVSYLHVYVDRGGKVVSDIIDSPNRPEDAKLGYGRLRVKNYMGVEITNIMFRKKIGAGVDATYDTSKDYVVQRVGPGSEAQPATVVSDPVEEGNYVVYCTLADGSEVFNGLDFYVLQDEVAYQDRDNVIEIRQVYAPPPTTIMYTVTGNGGPPAAINADAYTTTELTFTFSAPVPAGIVFEPTAMISDAGQVTKESDLVYKVAITDAKDETAKFTVSGTNVDTSEHQVHIYVKDDPPPPNTFIPVTDVVVTNEASFTKGTPKTIQWNVIPDNATNKAAFWTLGEMDGNMILANFLGRTPPYGLGADGKQHTDAQGRVTVRTSWSQNFLNLAVIVHNGIAEGVRNPLPKTFGGPVVDINGMTVTVTIQALVYDPDKDFVKLFRFVAK
jgi:hypothetical protein